MDYLRADFRTALREEMRVTEPKAKGGAAQMGRKNKRRKRWIWEARLESAMILLGFVWLLLLILEFAYGRTPFLETLSTTIWIVCL